MCLRLTYDLVETSVKCFQFQFGKQRTYFPLLVTTLCTQSLEKRSEYRQSFAEGGIDGLHLLELSTSEMAGTLLLFGHSS